MASLQEKAAFFDQLKVSYSDDEFDAAEQLERRRCRRFFNSRPTQSDREPIFMDLTGDEPMSKKPTQQRKTSTPMPMPSGGIKIIKGTPMTAQGRKSKLRTLLNRQSSEVILVDDTPIPETARQTQISLQQGSSTPMFPLGRQVSDLRQESPSTNMAVKKRKREHFVKQRPRNEQIFKELAFFYVPDDDIAPARRLRITKAREYGATWVRSPRAASHIVVDKHIQFKDIKNVLNKANGHVPPKVVNDDYPLDCIQFKTLLQHDQKRYQLVGQPAVQECEEVSTSPDKSVESLKLKLPHNNRKYIPPQSTPDRSEGSSRRSQIRGAPEEGSLLVSLDLEGFTSSFKGEVEITGGKELEEVLETNTNKDNTITQTDGHKDELSEYITLMLEHKDLPLDTEDDDTHAVLEMGQDDSDGSEFTQEKKQTRDATRRKTRSSHGKKMTFEDRFACNSAGPRDVKAGNPNTRTIEVLQSMADYYNRVNDQWRTTAYCKVISTLKRQDTKITTAEEASRLPSIGQRLAQKIEEIVTTDRLRRLEYAQKEPMDEALQLFLGIYGVGNSQAQQWLAQGYRTLDDLRLQAKLTQNQLVGVDHYGDLNTRIPRREVEALGDVVKKAAQQIDAEVEIIIGGSYRRGAESSGDVDLIVAKPNTTSSSELCPFLDRLIERLEAEKFLVARLASSRSQSDGSKWHGCCAHPSINDRPVWRRIDFLLVPETEMGAALIYFTGNDIFNRSLRLLASKKNMRLNQRGLYKDVMRGPQRVKVTEGELLEGRDERRIFEILGVEWREPRERWC